MIFHFCWVDGLMLALLAAGVIAFVLLWRHEKHEQLRLKERMVFRYTEAAFDALSQQDARINDEAYVMEQSREELFRSEESTAKVE